MGVPAVVGFLCASVAIFPIFEVGRNLTLSWHALSSLAETLHESKEWEFGNIITHFMLACCTLTVIRWLKNRCRGFGLLSLQHRTRTLKGPENVEHPIPRRRKKSSYAAYLCKDALIKVYTTTGSFVQLLPWADDDQKHIMDIYTDLELQNTHGRKEKVESFEDIFHRKRKRGHPIKRIICKGLPGYGKSTLLDKIAYDWAVHSVQALLKYELVIVLKMGALEQHSDLIDAIFDQLLDEDTPVNKSDLKSFIDSNPDKILVLLDGFDEFLTTELVETSFGSILKMLNRKVSRECCVVVTTRPSHYQRLVSRSLIKTPFTHVSVLGFNKESVEKYVNKFYSEEPGEAHELLRTIQSTDVLCELARSPMLVLLMCLLWRDDSKLPATLTRLYEQALRYIFRRKSNSSEEKISRILIKLGKIAIEGLLYPQQKLLFREGLFEETLLSVALKVGLLTKQRVLRVFDEHNIVQFIHKTFQEFCGAKYLQYLLEANYEEFQKILNDIDGEVTRNPNSFEYLLRFCCGDHRMCTAKILHIFRGKAHYALNYYFECQADILSFEDFIASVFCKSMHLVRDKIRFRHSFFWLLKEVADSDSTSHLINVQELSINDWNVRRYDNELRCGLCKMTQLQSIDLLNTSLTRSNMNVIAQSFEHLANLTRFTIFNNQTLRGSLTSWAPHLQLLKKLRQLEIEDCDLESRDVISLATACGKIQELDECLAQDHTRSMQMTTRNNNGTSLSLKKCSLATEVDGRALAEMFESMGGRGDLVEIHLAGNRVKTAKAHLWAPTLKTLQQLRLLSLRKFNLQTSDMEHIAAAVSGMPTLDTLILSDNESLGGCGQFLGTLFKETTVRQDSGASQMRLDRVRQTPHC